MMEFHDGRMKTRFPSTFLTLNVNEREDFGICAKVM